MNDRLPTLDELPDADVVIFDGHCRFCRGQVERLRGFDGGGRLAFVSLHDPFVAEHYPELTHEQMMAEMFVVSRDGQQRGGASAIRYLSRRLPRLWWLAPLLHIPGSLAFWRFLYRQVAQRRYELAGKLTGEESCEDGTCEIHLGGRERSTKG
jgi:predicted DCC family thiol-disulfide oxidoreductase YuxK